MATQPMSPLFLFLLLSMSVLSGASRNGSPDYLMEEAPALKKVLQENSDKSSSLSAEGVKKETCDKKLPEKPDSFAEVGTDAAGKEPEANVKQSVSSFVEVSDHKRTEKDEEGSEEDDHDGAGEHEGDENHEEEEEDEADGSLIEISGEGDRANTGGEDEKGAHVEIHDSDITIDEEHIKSTGDEIEEEEEEIDCTGRDCKVPATPAKIGSSTATSSNWRSVCAPIEAPKVLGGDIASFVSRIRIFEIHGVENVKSRNDVKTGSLYVDPIAVTVHRRSDALKDTKLKKLYALAQTSKVIARDPDFTGFGCPMMVEPDDKFEIHLWDLSKSTPTCRGVYKLEWNELMDFTYQGDGASMEYSGEFQSCYGELGAAFYGDTGDATRVRFSITELYFDIDAPFGPHPLIPPENLPEGTSPTVCPTDFNNQKNVPGWCLAPDPTGKKELGKCPAIDTFDDGNWRTWVANLWILHFGYSQNTYDKGETYIEWEMKSIEQDAKDKMFKTITIKGNSQKKPLPIKAGSCTSYDDCTSKKPKTWFNFGCAVLAGDNLVVSSLSQRFKGYATHKQTYPMENCLNEEKAKLRTQQAHQPLQQCRDKKPFTFKKAGRDAARLTFSKFKASHNRLTGEVLKKARQPQGFAQAQDWEGQENYPGGQGNSLLNANSTQNGSSTNASLANKDL